MIGRFFEKNHVSEKYKKQVDAEKTLITYRNTPATLVGNILGSLPIGIVMADTPHAESVKLWMATLFITILIRWALHQSFNPSGLSYQQLFHFGKLQALLIFITGCVWGSAGIFFVEANEIENVTAVVLTFACMLAGSLASLSAMPLAYASFSIPIMLPLIVHMYMLQQPLYQWMAFGATVYLIATFIFCLNIYRVIVRSLSLQYENTDLIADLQEQKSLADKANQDKSRFLASASHDLRQPLHAVSLLTDVLSEKLNGTEQEKDLHGIRYGLNSLNELLDALLDISRLDADIVKTEKYSFDLCGLLKKLEPAFTIESQKKGINFSISSDRHTIHSDPLLLERVITNLLVNAFRYTSEGEIAVYYTIRDGLLRLHISDTGIGIDQKHLDDIFKEFYQIDNGERNRQKGLGLGLAIVQRILNILDHQIEIKSEPNKGTEVILVLPLSKEKNNAVPQQAQETVALNTFNMLSGVKVALIDNELDIVEAMQSLLETWGCICTTYTSTEVALSCLEHGPRPDILLVDYRMPGNYNGCTFVKRVDSFLKNIPALIITGETSEDVISEITQNNLPYLHKPVKAVQLRVLITRILAKEASEKRNNPKKYQPEPEYNLNKVT